MTYATNVIYQSNAARNLTDEIIEKLAEEQEGKWTGQSIDTKKNPDRHIQFDFKSKAQAQRFSKAVRKALKGSKVNIHEVEES